MVSLLGSKIEFDRFGRLANERRFFRSPREGFSRIELDLAKDLGTYPTSGAPLNSSVTLILPVASC